MKCNEINLRENVKMVITPTRTYGIGGPGNMAGIKISNIRPYFSVNGNLVLYLLCDKDDNVLSGIPNNTVTSIEFM